MSVEVIKAGLLDTIQDGGRYGHQHFGVNPGGAMDLFSANIANMLVQNEKNAAVIELHFPASVFKFNDVHLIAITGADFEPEIDGKSVPLNTLILVSKDAVLQFKKYIKGARAYLAVHGNWQLDLWLSSYSTNIKAMAGGYKGRALKKGDLIEILIAEQAWQSLSNTTVLMPVSVSYQSSGTDNVLRYLPGNEYDMLTNQAKAGLDEKVFTITHQSDRMGYRLSGDVLKCKTSRQVLSSAVIRGTVQLLPSGQIIILMADHQTTGGYPKIAQVISADFSKLSQLRPNESIRFQQVTLKEAEDALIDQHELLQSLQEQVGAQFKKLVK